MAGVRIVVDDADLGAGLASLRDRLGDLRPFFLDIGEELLTSTRDRFLSQVGPDGAGWAALSPAYLKSKQKRDSRFPTAINRRSGEMMASVAIQASSTQLEVGTNKVYAAIRQFGGTVNSKGRQIVRRYKGKDGSRKLSVYLKGSSSAQQIGRPFLGVSSSDLTNIAAALNEYLAGS